jgi:hypothetical protein
LQIVPWAAGQLIGDFSSSSKITRGPPEVVTPEVVTRGPGRGAHAATAHIAVSANASTSRDIERLPG